MQNLNPTDPSTIIKGSRIHLVLYKKLILDAVVDNIEYVETNITTGMYKITLSTGESYTIDASKVGGSNVFLADNIPRGKAGMSIRAEDRVYSLVRDTDPDNLDREDWASMDEDGMLALYPSDYFTNLQWERIQP